MRTFRGRLSARDQAIAVNKALDTWAAGSGREAPQELRNVVAPKANRVKRPVDGKPTQPSEHQIQAAVIAWWALAHRKYQLPEFCLFAVPSGGARDVITGSLLKAEGVRRGVPDLILARPVGPYSGLFLELKVGYNKPSEQQAAFLQYVQEVGYQSGCYWNAENAIAAIEEYLRGADIPLPWEKP